VVVVVVVVVGKEREEKANKGYFTLVKGFPLVI
jgi:hypothetical protein